MKEDMSKEREGEKKGTIFSLYFGQILGSEKGLFEC